MVLDSSPFSSEVLGVWPFAFLEKVALRSLCFPILWIVPNKRFSTGLEVAKYRQAVHHWTLGRDTALDVTVINPLQRGLVDRSAEEAGHALLVAKRRKESGSKTACEREEIAFVPLAVETLGGWDQQAQWGVKAPTPVLMK